MQCYLLYSTDANLRISGNICTNKYFYIHQLTKEPVNFVGPELYGGSQVTRVFLWYRMTREFGVHNVDSSSVCLFLQQLKFKQQKLKSLSIMHLSTASSETSYQNYQYNWKNSDCCDRFLLTRYAISCGRQYLCSFLSGSLANIGGEIYIYIFFNF